MTPTGISRMLYSLRRSFFAAPLISFARASTSCVLKVVRSSWRSDRSDSWSHRTRHLGHGQYACKPRISAIMHLSKKRWTIETWRRAIMNGHTVLHNRLKGSIAAGKANEEWRHHKCGDRQSSNAWWPSPETSKTIHARQPAWNLQTRASLSLRLPLRPIDMKSANTYGLDSPTHDGQPSDNLATTNSFSISNMSWKIGNTGYDRVPLLGPKWR